MYPGVINLMADEFCIYNLYELNFLAVSTRPSF